MDERLIALNDKVASAAQAWLTDPTDTRAYGRLVAAVRERWGLPATHPGRPPR